jgi:endoglucanase
MVKFMEQTAQKNNIKYQKEILTAGGTDTAGIQRMNPGGAIAGAISIPTRHIHQVIEMANKYDIKGSTDLLTQCLLDIDKYDWNF